MRVLACGGFTEIVKKRLYDRFSVDPRSIAIHRGRGAGWGGGQRDFLDWGKGRFWTGVKGRFWTGVKG
eukprot:5339927-Pleurochrysis_carterae.AAC.1